MRRRSAGSGIAGGEAALDQVLDAAQRRRHRTLRRQREARDRQVLARQPRAHQFGQHFPGRLGHHGLAEDARARLLQFLQQLERAQARCPRARRRRLPGRRLRAGRRSLSIVRRMSSASAFAVSAICCSSRAPGESPVVARTLRMLSARVSACCTASRSGLRFDRLEQVIARLEPHGGDGRLERGLSGDEQQLQPRPVGEVAAHRAEELDAVGRRHVDVADDDVDLRHDLEQVERLRR